MINILGDRSLLVQILGNGGGFCLYTPPVHFYVICCIELLHTIPEKLPVESSLNSPILIESGVISGKSAPVVLDTSCLQMHVLQLFISRPASTDTCPWGHCLGHVGHCGACGNCGSCGSWAPGAACLHAHSIHP